MCPGYIHKIPQYIQVIILHKILATLQNIHRGTGQINRSILIHLLPGLQLKLVLISTNAQLIGLPGKNGIADDRFPSPAAKSLWQIAIQTMGWGKAMAVSHNLIDIQGTGKLIDYPQSRNAAAPNHICPISLIIPQQARIIIIHRTAMVRVKLHHIFVLVIMRLQIVKQHPQATICIAYALHIGICIQRCVFHVHAGNLFLRAKKPLIQ